MNRIQFLWLKTKAYYQEQITKERSPYLGVHDLDHVARVLRNTNLLIPASPEPLQLPEVEQIHAGAILHDIGYCVLAQPASDHRTHIRNSIELSQTFLASTSFTTKEITAIQAIITCHHDTEHSQKTFGEKVVYLADKLDMIGLDGLLRMYIKSSTDSLNRDVVAAVLLEKLEKRVQEDLLQIGIGRKLIELRWQETKWLLNEILMRGALNEAYISSAPYME